MKQIHHCYIVFDDIAQYKGVIALTYVYIKFETQTLGEKAKNVLLKNGFKAKLKPNPNPDHRQGCNFALFVQGDVLKAFDIINKHKIENLGVESYRERL